MYPKISRADLDSAPPGLYQIDEPPVFHAEMYDLVRRMVTSAWTQAMARIDDSTVLPDGVEFAAFRADGKRLVIAAVPVEAPTSSQ